MILTEKKEALLEEWHEILNCEPQTVLKLIDHGVLVRRDKLWRLEFVGTIVLPRSAWISIPAAAANAQKSSQGSLFSLERLLRVLEEYGNRSKSRKTLTDKLTNYLSLSEKALSPLRELDLLSSLIDWTSSHGFHTAETERASKTFSDPIDWPRTFSQSLAISSPSGLVFDDPARSRTVKHLSSLAIEQAKVISRLIYKYRDVASLTVRFSADLEAEANDLVMPFGEVEDLLLSDLQEAYQATNRDHDKDLISLLIAYQDIQMANNASTPSISLFGTTAFELVWEDICRHLCEGRPISEAQLSRTAYDLEAANSIRWVDSQRPDIVIIENEHTILLDAKYYAKFPQQLPGLEDVRKQIFYQLTLPPEKKGLTAFLIPQHSSASVNYLGLAKIAKPNGVTADDDYRFPPVHCLGLDWEQALDTYLGSASNNSIKKKIISILTSKKI